MNSLLLTFSALVKGTAIAVLVFYSVRYFRPKNEANNWISAFIIGFCLAFFASLLSAFAPVTGLAPLCCCFALFYRSYKLSGVQSFIISAFVGMILFFVPPLYLLPVIAAVFLFLKIRKQSGVMQENSREVKF